MSQVIKQRIVIVLKILTVISFLCIVVDNGKFELPMALLLLGPFVVGGSLGEAPDVATILYSVMFMLYGILLCASLLYLFVTAVSPTFSKKVTIISIIAILVLWVQVGLTANTSFPHSSFIVALTHGIFALLSLATMFFIGLGAKKEKITGA
jgi:heme A synthase